MTDFYTKNERERLQIVLKSEIERQTQKHQTILAGLRLLAAII